MRKIILVLTISFLSLGTINAFSQPGDSGPPPPPVCQNGNSVVGGPSAPLNDGVTFLLILSCLYGGYCFNKARKQSHLPSIELND